MDEPLDLWEPKVEPAGKGAVTVSLVSRGSCGNAAAVCTSVGTALTKPSPTTVPGPPLRATFKGLPSEHDGLSGTGVTDVQALAGLPNLKVLLLDGNAVTDIWPLAGLEGIENLGLSGNRIGDATGLQDLPRLRRLDLRGNPVRDLSALGDVGSLVWLALPGERGGGSVEVVGRLTRLDWLWIGRDREDVAVAPEYARRGHAGPFVDGVLAFALKKPPAEPIHQPLRSLRRTPTVAGQADA